MMSNTEERPNWKTRKWWETTLGVNRDEFTDSYHRQVIKRAAQIMLVTGLPSTLYGWYAGAPFAIGVTGVLILLLLWIGYRYRQLRPEDGVWDEYTLIEYALIYKVPLFIMYPLFFLLMIAGGQLGWGLDEVWSIPLLAAALAIIPFILRKQVYPWQHWVFVGVVTIFAAAFGAALAVDALPNWADWSIAIGFLVAIAYSVRYYMKQEV